MDAGPAAALSPGTLASTIQDLAGDVRRREAMSQRCKAVIDGQGANRIAAVLQSLAGGGREKAV